MRSDKISHRSQPPLAPPLLEAPDRDKLPVRLSGAAPVARRIARTLDVDTELWERVKETFQQAVELRGEERAAFLEAAGREAPQLRASVEKLLDLDRETTAWLQGRFRLPEAPETPAREGERLGPYLLLEPLGEGGMGTVYRAQRVDGEFDQQVAIKLVGGKRSSPELLRRFLAERQILARLEHRNIARLLDGGTTPDGVPFLVLERVVGEPITDACRNRRLDTEGRIQLMRQVCAAVELAHRNLVVHRDLKPNNILVTADGTAKLLDFGIAKLLERSPEDSAAPTRIMTPRYASPEQLLGKPVTTACDIYSLGLILYEMLAGRHPFEDPEDTSASTIERRLSQTLPVPPSRVADDGPPRAVGLGRLTDLDRIVLKTLERDPARRYASAGALRDDLQRFLNNEPIEAAPPNRLYRLGKFISRHRLALVAASLVVLSLATGFIARSLEAQTARRAERQAEAVAEYLVDIFRDADPDQARGKEVTARELVGRGIERVDELEAEPLVRSRLLLALGEVSDALGNSGQASELLASALEIARGELGDDHLEVANTLFHLGFSQLNEGDYTAAAESLERSAAIYRRAGLALKEATSLDEAGVAYHQLGRLEEAERVFAEALELRRRFSAPPPQRASSLNHIGTLFWHQGRLDEARPLLEEALALREEHFGPDHPAIAVALNSLAIVAATAGDSDDALRFFERALELRERVLGPDHPQTGQIVSNLGTMSLELGEAEAALPHTRRAVRIYRDSQGASPGLSRALAAHGRALMEVGRWSEAGPTLEEALAMHDELVGSENKDTALMHFQLARLRRFEGRMDEVRKHARQVLETCTSTLPEDFSFCIDAKARLPELLDTPPTGRTEESTDVAAL